MERYLQRSPRYLLLVGILGLAWILQTVAHWYLTRPGSFPATPLLRPLAEFPFELGPWKGRDAKIEDPAWNYADSHLNRVYYDSGRAQAISLWMAYSLAGRDREHNPEVCMPAHGKYEDEQQRQLLPAENPGAPIQQFRFIKPRGEQGEWVFYWYYTLVPQIEQQASAVQLIYLLRRWRPSSLTIEVFAPDIAEDDVAGAREFALQVDRALQSHLPQGAIRDNRRRSIRLFNEGGVQ